jgi:hypothetical protein
VAVQIITPGSVFVMAYSAIAGEKGPPVGPAGSNDVSGETLKPPLMSNVIVRSVSKTANSVSEKVSVAGGGLLESCKAVSFNDTNTSAVSKGPNA